MSDAAARAALDVLRAVALDHRIGGVLLLDLDPVLLRPLGAWLAGACATAGPDPRLVTLGSWTTDDDLWSRTRLDGAGGIRLEAGPLVEQPGDPPLIVLIPDLARAGLAVHRAAVVLAGAGVAAGGRLGDERMWAPRGRWLAACSRQDAAQLSGHLLDRFPVRCDGTAFNTMLATADRAAAWAGTAEPRRTHGHGQAAGVREGTAGLWQAPASASVAGQGPAAFAAMLPPHDAAPVGGSPARIGPDAIDELLAVAPPSPGARRDLALARLSRVVARAGGAAVVQREHVRTAAALLGVRTAAELPAVVAPPLPPVTPVDRLDGLPTELPPLDDLPGTGGGGTSDGSEPASQVPADAAPGLFNSGSATPLDVVPIVATPAGAGRTMYPEDITAVAYASHEVQVAGKAPQRHRPGRGAVTGAEPSNRVHDFAAVATLLEAMKRRGERGRPVVRPSDVRRHRRRPEPACGLVLVLDHTCRRDWEWADTLNPYLRWAHGNGAAVTVIEFGHADTGHELRAARFRARSAYDPRVTQSLRRAPGGASPLAHAVDLAVDELRRFGRRQVPVSELLLLVVTDARGNVPFDASVLGRVDGIVGRRGLTDAVAAAWPIARMRRVQALVVTPGSGLYPQLPFELADAMGATVIAPVRPGTAGQAGR
ncbi:hypothetical protein [Dactylosporangium sp. NPDC050588]|uniref:hypothetical protein n=1 Tax=Dactylosporangium sp. NPDC050588 TaxID=3157211 RepID=UPI003409C885